MKMIKRLQLGHLIAGTLLVYVTLHVLEEGVFGFPAWAEVRWGIPNYTTSKWLLHNVYFAFFLGLGYVVYRINRERFLFAGLGIVVWGLLNAASHVVFTVIFLEYAPGLFTGLIFLASAILAFRGVGELGRLSWKTALPAILTGMVCWGAPIFLFIEVDRALGL